MGTVARFAIVVSALATACYDEDFPPMPRCPDRVDDVSVDEPIDDLDGETAAERFDRAAQFRDCVVSWLEIPAQLGSAEPPPSSSALELLLERTSDTARYREYSLGYYEKFDSLACHPAALFVPCSLTLRSDDGALDEVLDCELRLQGPNTLLNRELGAYDFAGTHAVSFTDGVPVDTVELNLVYTPGAAPERVHGGIAESGDFSGSADPLLTTAIIGCPTL